MYLPVARYYLVSDTIENWDTTVYWVYGVFSITRYNPCHGFEPWRLNIHPNVDGEVAYAAPNYGLAVGYIQV